MLGVTVRPRVRAAIVAGLALAGTLVAVGGTDVAAGGAAPRTDLTATDLAAAATETISAPKSASGRRAQTDPALLGVESSAPVNVMIKYDYDPTASYSGGVAGLAPTSTAATGKTLSENSAAVEAYDRYAVATSEATSAALVEAVPGAEIRSSFSTVYGGVAAQVPADRVADILEVEGVAAVQADALNQPLDDNTEFVGATAVWPALGGSTTAGSGVIVGNLDTGVWPEHPMLDPTGIAAPPGGLRDCSAFATGADVANLGPAFSCNNKLIGAYNKTATYMAQEFAGAEEFCNSSTGVCSPRDANGHGTHTVTTTAGNCAATAVLYGVDRGPVCGVAPGAHVIEYRVCLEQGCFDSDSVSAVEQAILDGVHVINFSISGGADPYTDPVELAFLDAVNAGIAVHASAGNSGPGAGTLDHAGPWTTTVGASTGPRSFTSTLHLTADGGATFDMSGVTLTNGVASPAPVVLAQNVPGSGNLCLAPLAAGSAAGKIVACARGVNARTSKGFNVAAGGAVGMILYNTVNQDVATDNHWLPAIHLNGPPTALLDFVNGHTNVQAEWDQGQPTASPADVMAAFSSRGPRGDWIKPDVTAPGVQVLAGTTPQPVGGLPGNLYMAIAGTSMSSPHAAGVAALVKASHPTWTPAQIKSALMTSSVQTVVKEDGVTPAGPFDMGAGSIRADRAVNPTLVFDETYADYLGAETDVLRRINLNIPSINATTMSGAISTTRTATNVSGERQTLTVEITQPAGVTITVGKNNGPIVVRKDQEVTFPITISAPEVADGQYTARINLVPKKGGTPVTMPVAFVKQQGIVTLTHSCAPTTLPVKTRSNCSATVTNLSPSAAATTLDVAQQGRPGSELKYTNISAPASAIRTNKGVHWEGSLNAPVAPTVTSITDITGGGPAGGYLPLSDFSIAPIPGVGDESLTNVNVPQFYYGGEAYTRLGVGSNGYVVIGGGTAADVLFAPQTFPNPARPNNVLAPLWTDLDPPAGGAVRIGLLGDADAVYIVVDWAGVPNYSDGTVHTFETWIRISDLSFTGPASEQITYSYGAGANAGLGDPGSGVNWGAENRDGTSGQNIVSAPADGSEYRPNTSPATPGGSVTVTFDASAGTAKTFSSVASMTSDQTAGTATVVQNLTFTK